MAGPIVVNYDKAFFKKCIKCRQWKAKEAHTDENGREWKKAFGPHADNADGYQVICYQCKGVANTAARNKNVAYRLRHHTGTRCLTQLGEHAPEGFVKDLEKYLGYKITSLVRYLRKDLKEREGPKRKLRDALDEGYHIDHRVPLSSFRVIIKADTTVGQDSYTDYLVDWDAFKACWAMTNLRAIPGEENLAKGAKQNVGTQNEETQADEERQEEVSIDITAAVENQP